LSQLLSGDISLTCRMPFIRPPSPSRCPRPRIETARSGGGLFLWFQSSSIAASHPLLQSTRITPAERRSAACKRLFRAEGPRLGRAEIGPLRPNLAGGRAVACQARRSATGRHRQPAPRGFEGGSSPPHQVPVYVNTLGRLAQTFASWLWYDTGSPPRQVQTVLHLFRSRNCKLFELLHKHSLIFSSSILMR